MFIQTLPLKDEDRMQFLPGRQVMPNGNVSFEAADAAKVNLRWLNACSKSLVSREWSLVKIR